MRALLIPVEGETRIVDIASYEDLSTAVGGFIQALGYPDGKGGRRGDVTVYINEEGKIEGLPYNRAATVRLMTPEMGYMTGDYISGDAIVIGFDPSTGEDIDLPEDIVP